MNRTTFGRWQSRSEAALAVYRTMTSKLLFCLLSGLTGLGSLVQPIVAQTHRFHSDQQPQGIIGREQAVRIPGGMGYYQPVQIKMAGGAKVAVLNQTEFTTANDQQVVGMQVGSTYRLKVTNVPEHPGVELYPSIEIINRLYPPDQMVQQFPVTIELNYDDLVLAAEGAFLIKVVYLEDPAATSVQTHDGENQPQFDVAQYEDVLDTADMMGRPMAIVRMGSRIPLENTQEMVLDSAPIQTLQPNERMGQPARVFNLNQKYADQDPSYVPQMSKPRQGNSDLWNMEHIFDGGDRAAKASVGVGDDWEIHGVETEDTIAHFDTLDGRREVVPSNRVSIYSPRFAAVRKRIQLAAANMVLPVVTGEKTDVAHLAASKAGAGAVSQHDQALLARGANQAEAMRQQQRVAWANSTVKVLTASGNVGAFENTALIKHGKLDGSEKAWLAKGQVAAAVWGGSEGVRAIADFQEVNIIYNAVNAAEVVESHRPGNKPRLRVIKIASQDAAQAGETIEFTIRFDNLGDQLIGNVTLMDNLTDRLEYIEGSAKCDLKCKFYTQMNDRGSNLLRWDIEKPLKVNEGGVIRFQCRVK